MQLQLRLIVCSREKEDEVPVTSVQLEHTAITPFPPFPGLWFMDLSHTHPAIVETVGLYQTQVIVELREIQVPERAIERTIKRLIELGWHRRHELDTAQEE